MNVNHVLKFSNQGAVFAFQRFLTSFWDQLGLDAMLAPVETPDQPEIAPHVIETPDALAEVNPFAPIMLVNTAALVEDFVDQYSGKRLAIILRPCEFRTLIELHKRHQAPAFSQARNSAKENVLLIGVDCPGTFSTDQYNQRAIRRGVDLLTQDSLFYGTRDVGSVQEFRQACQICDKLVPLGADLSIGTIGVVPTGFMLMIAEDGAVDEALQVGKVTDGIATEEQVVQRELAVGNLINQRLARQKELVHTSDVGEELGSFLGIFARCTLCADCLDVCPLYNGELTGMLGVGKNQEERRALLPELVRLSRWLASCSGCGMCQEACEHGISLGRMIASLSSRICTELRYNAGSSLQHLPWEAA